MAAPARRHGAAVAGPPKSSRVPCKFYAAGTCSRDPCGFKHTAAEPSAATASRGIAGSACKSKHAVKKNSAPKPRKPRLTPPEGVCKFSWNHQPCPFGKECRYKHHVHDYSRPDSDDDRGAAFDDWDGNGGGDYRNSREYMES